MSHLQGAQKPVYPPDGEGPAVSGELAQAEELRPLTPGELAAVFSNLARGCEKQYHPEEEACFQELAAYFAGLAPQEPDASVAQLLALFQEDLAQGYPAYQAAAQAAGDRGSQRVRVWGEKVTTMVRSLLEQYLRQGEDFLKTPRCGCARSVALSTWGTFRRSSARCARCRSGNSSVFEGGGSMKKLLYAISGSAQRTACACTSAPRRDGHRGQRHRREQVHRLRRLRRGLPQRGHIHGAGGVPAPAAEK